MLPLAGFALRATCPSGEGPSSETVVIFDESATEENTMQTNLQELHEMARKAGETQKMMPMAAQRDPSEAMLDLSLARELRAKRALEAAPNLQDIAQTRWCEATEEMISASEAVERARKRVIPTADMATKMENSASTHKTHTCRRCHPMRCWWRRKSKRRFRERGDKHRSSPRRPTPS